MGLVYALLILVSFVHEVDLSVCEKLYSSMCRLLFSTSRTQPLMSQQLQRSLSSHLRGMFPVLLCPHRRLHKPSLHTAQCINHLSLTSHLSQVLWINHVFFSSPFVCGILEPEVCHCPSDTSLTAEFAPEDQSVPIPVPAAAAASSLAAERSQDGDEENPLKPHESVEEEKMGLVKQEEHLKVQDEENTDRRETAAETGEVDSFSLLHLAP